MINCGKMVRYSYLILAALAVLSSVAAEPTASPLLEAEVADTQPRDEPAADEASEEPPEGYYAFVESPNATPPRVRGPPYRQTAAACDGAGAGAAPHVSAHNLCGDLNRGLIPRNPMRASPLGEPYPFELIRNHTLRFLSRTLPVLRADSTLPRVAHLPQPHLPQPQPQPPRVSERSKRSPGEGASSAEGAPAPLPAEHRAREGAREGEREGRKFCDGGGVFCMLYRAINGDSEASAAVERREDPGTPHPQHPLPQHRYEGPPTPCPARVEYATPVFARNYQGVWRYVVQIPYEGYFTQTVEVTRCLQARCHYLEGGCLSSPRWVSLLVAELHYPPPHPDYQQYLQAAAAEADAADKPPHCDGHDELGCFQVRLYYDWFLVPGSCKCWRPDYFARYVRRRQSNEL